MGLISREVAIDKLNAIPSGNWSKDRYMRELLNVPSVPAVPLDKLCLLLHDIVGSPCYTQPGEDMCNQLIDDQCNTEWDDAECWKQFLTKWMEEQDADRQ